MSLINVTGVDTHVILQEVIPVSSYLDLKTSIHHQYLHDHFCSCDDTDPAHLYFCFSPFKLTNKGF